MSHLLITINLIIQQHKTLSLNLQTQEKEKTIICA